MHGVGDERLQVSAMDQVFVADFVDVELPSGLAVGGKGSQHAVLARHDEPQAFAQNGGVEEVANANAGGSADLVHVTGTDPAPGRADRKVSPLPALRERGRG